MQKIIIDTNVLVSALIQKNYPHFILYNYVFENLVEVCISDELFKEYIDVINRPKFVKYPDFVKRAELILVYIDTNSSKFYPTQRFDLIQDKADNRLLELALESGADYIITGNTTDFSMNDFKGTKIITPKEYWDNYRE